MVWLRIRRWVVRPFFWSLAAAAFVLLCLRAFLSSDFARERIAVRLEQQLSQILHREVRLGRLDFELLPFALRIEDFSISGPTPSDPSLLTIRRLRVDADLDALKHDLLDLQTVSAQGVRVHIELYPDGRDNLPEVAASGGASRFDVRIGGLFVEDGEFELDDRRVPLAVSAHALLLRLSGLGGTELQGNVTAQEVVTTLPRALPWPATLTAKVRLRDDGVEILAARVRSPDLDARVAGFVGWHGGTNGEIHGVVESEGRFLDDLGYLSGEIAGPLRFEGAVRFAHKDIGLTGRLTSPGVDLFGLRLDDLAGQVASGGSRVSSLGLTLEQAVFAGGPVAGTFDVDFERPAAGENEQSGQIEPRLQLALGELGMQRPGEARRRLTGSCSCRGLSDDGGAESGPGEREVGEVGVENETRLGERAGDRSRERRPAAQPALGEALPGFRREIETLGGDGEVQRLVGEAQLPATRQQPRRRLQAQLLHAHAVGIPVEIGLEAVEADAGDRHRGDRAVHLTRHVIDRAGQVQAPGRLAGERQRRRQPGHRFGDRPGLEIDRQRERRRPGPGACAVRGERHRADDAQRRGAAGELDAELADRPLVEDEAAGGTRRRTARSVELCEVEGQVHRRRPAAQGDGRGQPAAAGVRQPERPWRRFDEGLQAGDLPQVFTRHLDDELALLADQIVDAAHGDLLGLRRQLDLLELEPPFRQPQDRRAVHRQRSRDLRRQRAQGQPGFAHAPPGVVQRELVAHLAVSRGREGRRGHFRRRLRTPRAVRAARPAGRRSAACLLYTSPSPRD